MRLWPRRARCWQVAHRHGHGINEGYPLCLTALAIPIASQARPDRRHSHHVWRSLTLPSRYRDGARGSSTASSPHAKPVVTPRYVRSSRHYRHHGTMPGYASGAPFGVCSWVETAYATRGIQVRINSEFRLVAVKAFVARTRVIPNGRWLPRYRGQGKPARRRRAMSLLYTGPSGH